MTIRNGTYSNRQPIPSHPMLNRGLGVEVSAPHQRPKDAQSTMYTAVEITIEIPAPLNTTTTVAWCAAEHWTTLTIGFTKHVIGKIDEQIAILEAAKRRLADELAQLDNRCSTRT